MVEVVSTEDLDWKRKMIPYSRDCSSELCCLVALEKLCPMLKMELREKAQSKGVVFEQEKFSSCLEDSKGIDPF